MSNNKNTIALPPSAASTATFYHPNQPDDVQANLPSYLTQPSQANVGVVASVILEEAQETGDGGDSDNEGDDMEELHEAFNPAMNVRSGVLSFATQNNDIEEVAGDSDENSILLHRNNGSESNTHFNMNLQYPKEPDDWVDPEPKRDKEEPLFSTVDNPGGWSSYSFNPKFVSGRYDGHYLPTGCTPVPTNESGERKCGDWDFYYEGWIPTDENGEKILKHRKPLTLTNLFPKERKGSLDVDVLKKLGMKKKVLDEDNFLFFLPYHSANM